LVDILGYTLIKIRERIGNTMGTLIRKVAISTGVMLLLVGLSSAPLVAGEWDLSTVRVELEGLLTHDAATVGFDLDGSRVPLHERVAEFYRQRHYYPAWLEGRQLSAQARRLLEILQGASAEGLNPEDYHASTLGILDALNRALPSYGEMWDRQGRARLDILLTSAYLRYAGHLIRGRMDPAAVYPGEWRATPKTLDVVEVLREGLRWGNAAEALEKIAPKNPVYVGLRDHLAFCRRIAAEGGWPQIPAGKAVHFGESDWRIPWLRQHLAQVGDLRSVENVGTTVFDEETVAALQRFQVRHGLKPDGVFGPSTLAELNVSVEERIRQIELNMERSRWLPEDLGDRYLFVNIADFRLTVVEKGEEVLNMNVVVGTPLRRTPVFSSRLSYLIFSPYWNVPVSILRKDKLPLIKANVKYLTSHHYQIIAWKEFPNQILDPADIDWEPVTAENFPGLLRQKPGPWNALGRVKFMLPNSFDIFLHDTPEQSLFQRSERVFSSGCVRLERPAELADYLLRDLRDWNKERILQVMAAGQPERVDIPDHPPVHIFYQTAWVDGQGNLQFRKDVYQRDRDLYAALNGIPSEARSMLASEARRSEVRSEE
jgi:murein L,D-transpeptidase YcbB/YkuD